MNKILKCGETLIAPPPPYVKVVKQIAVVRYEEGTLRNKGFMSNLNSASSLIIFLIRETTLRKIIIFQYNNGPVLILLAENNITFLNSFSKARMAVFKLLYFFVNDITVKLYIKTQNIIIEHKNLYICDVLIFLLTYIQSTRNNVLVFVHA